jgi:hypothetical protein
MNAGTLMFPTNDQVALTTELHETIAEYEKKKLQSPWLGVLPFHLDTYGNGNYSKHDNILDLMQNTALSGHIIRFCPTKIPSKLRGCR